MEKSSSSYQSIFVVWHYATPFLKLFQADQCFDLLFLVIYNQTMVLNKASVWLSPGGGQCRSQAQYAEICVGETQDHWNTN